MQQRKGNQNSRPREQPRDLDECTEQAKQDKLEKERGNPTHNTANVVASGGSSRCRQSASITLLRPSLIYGGMVGQSCRERLGASTAAASAPEASSSAADLTYRFTGQYYIRTRRPKQQPFDYSWRAKSEYSRGEKVAKKINSFTERHNSALCISFHSRRGKESPAFSLGHHHHSISHKLPSTVEQ